LRTVISDRNRNYRFWFRPMGAERMGTKAFY
jgi:hypothetical protein